MSDDGNGDLRRAVARKGSLLRTIKAVAWSFFGVRKRSDLEQDLSQLNPLHLVIAGIVGALLFVLALVWVVNLVADGN